VALLTATEARLLIPGLASGSDDAKLDVLIARAEEALALFCHFPAGSSLSAATYTIYLDGPAPGFATELKLPIRPIVSIASIHDDPDWGYAAADLVASSEYIVNLAAGRVHLIPSSSHGWTTARRAIRVVADLGITIASDAVKQAIAEVVQANWGKRHTAGKASIAQGGSNQALIASSMHVPISAASLIQGYVMHEAAFSGGRGVAFG